MESHNDVGWNGIILVDVGCCRMNRWWHQLHVIHVDYIDTQPQHHSIQQPNGCAPFGGGVTKSDAAGEATLEEHPGCSPRSLALVRRGFGRMATPFNPGQKIVVIGEVSSPHIVKLNHGTSAVSGWTWSAVLEEGTWSASSKPWLRHPLIHSIPHSPYCWRKVHIIKLCSWETWVILTFIFGFPSFFTLIINSLLFRHLTGTIQT